MHRNSAQYGRPLPNYSMLQRFVYLHSCRWLLWWTVICFTLWGCYIGVYIPWHITCNKANINQCRINPYRVQQISFVSCLSCFYADIGGSGNLTSGNASNFELSPKCCHFAPPTSLFASALNFNYGGHIRELWVWRAHGELLTYVV